MKHITIRGAGVETRKQQHIVIITLSEVPSDYYCAFFRGRAQKRIFDPTADSRAHRATRGASDLIERTGRRERDAEWLDPAEVSLRWGGHRWRAPSTRGQQGRKLKTPPEGARLTHQRKRDEKMGAYRESRLIAACFQGNIQVSPLGNGI